MDPIADMLTIIRNAQAVKKEMVKFPYSKVKFNLAKVLEDKGFIQKTEVKGNKQTSIIILTLKYEEDGSPKISVIKRISKPGQRLYISYKNLKRVKSGYGNAIISTPKGLLTEQEAKNQKVGGEYMCEIW